MFAQRYAIKQYMKHLPELLTQLFGKQAHYSQIQVSQAVEYAGLSGRHIHYAFLIFADKKAIIRELNLSQETVSHMVKAIEHVSRGDAIDALAISTFENANSSMMNSTSSYKQYYRG
ncbi:DUF6559 family protein [Pleionea sediminis]|uniref:DUF6559 family protein n=1 Tax=Pleionea sediminis TaxID=2569479 RepID=UPI00118678B3|nr:DUF6559 family protein [Pleionea sediminis]